MRRLFAPLVAIAVLLWLSGCNQKNYFEPAQIKGAVQYDGELPAPIVEIGYAGATLQNGQVITRNGLQPYRLPAKYRYIGDNGEWVIAAGDCVPNILFRPSDGKRIELKLPRRLVAGLLIPDSTLLAFVLEGNRYGLYDYEAQRLVAKYDSDEALSCDIRIANPMVLDQLVLMPTLDGKLAILNRQNGAKVREIVVGKGEQFNNVIYLNVIGDRLVAATPHRIISVSPRIMDAQTMEIADVVFVDDAIFILAKDGTIYHCDTDLKIVASKKFPFAHYVGMIYGEYIYAVEREGYIIAADKELTVANVFELPERIEKWFYTTEDAFYYDRYYFRLNRDDQNDEGAQKAEEESDRSESSVEDTTQKAPSVWERIRSIFSSDDKKKEREE